MTIVTACNFSCQTNNNIGWKQNACDNLFHTCYFTYQTNNIIGIIFLKFKALITKFLWSTQQDLCQLICPANLQFLLNYSIDLHGFNLKKFKHKQQLLFMLLYVVELTLYLSIRREGDVQYEAKSETMFCTQRIDLVQNQKVSNFPLLFYKYR